MSTELTESERESIGRGGATPQTVIKYYQGVLEDHPELVHDLQSLHEVITSMMIDTSGKRIITAIACAIINLQFERLPVLYMVDDNGDYGTVVVNDEKLALGIRLGMLSR